ncbi:CocE/NonD family hydrolase [Knoellia koreensis]|uniref:ABC transporter ATP-binding protein n=1 Tax=Knoellia koreensis TaxID=2730921 RepID=A0A849HJR0_9MICO|nr:CocE/NonD family hydrolase [Knoellia sp. DB2414S]NNM46561.1 ABC transporter ATP-binding protein [Knoellia sp. DB2414S]
MSRPSRRLAAVATLAVGAGGVLLGQASGPAAAAPAVGTRTPAATSPQTLDAVDTYTGLTFTVPAGRNDLGQPQTCTIDADLYKPRSASATNRVPAILTTNGFGGSKDDQAGLGRAFAQRGYAVLSYTGLGFPDSGCKISLDDPGVDGVAASSLVTFLGGGSTAAYQSGDVGGTPAGPGALSVDFTKLDDPATHDPRLGMIGGSYGGQIQFATAATDSRVDTLVPLITWNDLRYSLAPNNTSFTSGVTYADDNPGTEKIGWAGLFFGIGILDGIQGTAIDPTRNVGCPNFVLEACTAKATLDTLGYPTSDTYRLTDRVSVAHYIDKVKTPTLLIQGQNDTLFNLQESVATYDSLKARGVPVSLVWQSWGHSGGANGNSGAAPGELDLTGQHIEDTYLGQRIKDWFDHYLKDAKTPTGPGFSYFRDWISYSGNAAPAYATAASYPVGTFRTFYLSGAGDLVDNRKAVRTGSTSWAGPGLGAPASYSEVSGLEGRVDLPPNLTTPYDTPGTFGAWTTAALGTPTTIVGSPKLTVRFDSPAVALTQKTGPAGRLQVFAKLYDVAPDGSQTLVHKLISPVRVADVTQPVSIELPGIVHRVEAGHRLRLVLASTDAAYKNSYAVQPVTVRTSPLAPPALTVPVVR